MTTVVEEEDVRNNARKTAAIKQLNEVLKTLNDQDKKVVEKLKDECNLLTNANEAMKNQIEMLSIDDDIEEDIMTITSDLQALKEASKNIEIKVEVDKGMMTTARNKLIDAIFMKTPKLDPHSFAIEFEEYNGEKTTFDADYFEVKIKSINPKTELKKFVLKEIKLSVYDIDDQTVLEEACIDDKIKQGMAEMITRHIFMLSPCWLSTASIF